MSAGITKTTIKITQKISGQATWELFLPPNPTSPVYQDPVFSKLSKDTTDPDEEYLSHIYRDVTRSQNFSYEILKSPTKGSIKHESPIRSKQPIQEGFDESKGEDTTEETSPSLKAVDAFIQGLYEYEKAGVIPPGTMFALTHQSGFAAFFIKKFMTAPFNTANFGMMHRKDSAKPGFSKCDYDHETRKLRFLLTMDSQTFYDLGNSQLLEGSEISTAAQFEVSFGADGLPTGDLVVTSTIDLSVPQDNTMLRSHFLLAALSHPNFLCQTMADKSLPLSVKTSIERNGVTLFSNVETYRDIRNQEEMLEQTMRFGADLHRLAEACLGESLSISKKRKIFREKFLELLEELKTPEEKNRLIEAFNILLTIPRLPLRSLMTRGVHFSPYSARSMSIDGKTLPVARTAQLISQLGKADHSPIQKRTAFIRTAKVVSFALCIGVVLTTALLFPPLAAAIAGGVLLILAGIAHHNIESKSAQKLAREKAFHQATLFGLGVGAGTGASAGVVDESSTTARTPSPVAPREEEYAVLPRIPPIHRLLDPAKPSTPSKDGLSTPIKPKTPSTQVSGAPEPERAGELCPDVV
jgi:hypothetical protein